MPPNLFQSGGCFVDSERHQQSVPEMHEIDNIGIKGLREATQKNNQQKKPQTGIELGHSRLILSSLSQLGKC